MSIQAMGWALNLTFKRPAAKLVAIRLGDQCSPEGVGSLSLKDLSEWCGMSPEAVQAELDYLIATVGITIRSLDDGEAPVVVLPLPAERERGPRFEPPLFIYVATSAIETKIGISQNAQNRMKEISMATLQPTTLRWSQTGPAKIIRKAERLAQDRLEPKQVSGEWFTLSVEEAIAAVMQALLDAERPPA